MTAGDNEPPIAADMRAAAARTASLHMPGHKRRLDALHPAAADLLGPAVTFDVSEIGGFDYLHGPHGSIAAAQQRAAALFGAGTTLFLVNGATVGNQAALLAATTTGSRVALFRASHRSVYAGIELSGAAPVYLEGPFDEAHGIAGFPTATELPDEPVDVVHVTRPTYYGSCVSLAPYRALADRHGALLVVDEAHGAHFAFDDRLPVPALEAGADVVIQSPHKTLGSLTQSALLHLRAGLEPAPFAHALGMLQSSSPNASLLVSLDLCVDHLARTGGSGVRSAVTLAQSLRDALAALPGISVLGTDLAPGIDDHDVTKLVLDVTARGLTGFQAAQRLRDAGVWVEFADARRLVATVTFADDAAAARALLDAVGALRGADQVVPPLRLPPRGDAVLAPGSATRRPSRIVPLAAAAGRVAADYVIPYPPGIPVVVPGERVPAELVAAVADLRAQGVRIVGPTYSDRLRVVDEG